MQRAAADTEKIPHNTFFFVIRFRYNIDVVLLRFQMIHAPTIPARMAEAVLLQTPGDSLASVEEILEVRDAMVNPCQQKSLLQCTV